MDYTPKYSQPFTFAQACELEVQTITKEISRLENSLFHLNRTQEELNDHLSGSQEEDKDLVSIIRENEAVIASQKERITMLKLALEEQGINATSAHYNSVEEKAGVGNAAASQRQDHSTEVVERDSRSGQQEETDHTDEGVYL